MSRGALSAVRVLVQARVVSTALVREKPVLRSTVQQYLRLSKHKLNGFIVFTTFVGYCMHPHAFQREGWLPHLAILLLGTASCSFSAAAFNQILEVPYDSQMGRTCTRPLPIGSLPIQHCVNYAMLTGTAGSLALLWGTNWATALLGATNIVLYVLVYTPLKRKSAFNTWVGAVVGAIPALMGWTGVQNSFYCNSHWISPLLLPALIFCWQFPHFLSLSWRLRKDYARAGFMMLSITNASQARRVMARYSLGIPVICWMLYRADLVDATFLLDSSLLNGYFLLRMWTFYRNSTQNHARKLFLASLVHLPILLLLLIGHHSRKKGLIENLQQLPN